MAEMTEEQEVRLESEEIRTQRMYAKCNRIDDPVERGLCKVCGTPAAGGLPFCGEHESTVP